MNTFPNSQTSSELHRVSHHHGEYLHKSLRFLHIWYHSRSCLQESHATDRCRVQLRTGFSPPLILVFLKSTNWGLCPNTTKDRAYPTENHKRLITALDDDSAHVRHCAAGTLRVSSDEGKRNAVMALWGVLKSGWATSRMADHPMYSTATSSTTHASFSVAFDGDVSSYSTRL